ncbi:MAG: magnesium/cobalt transporter CorA [Nitriliruptorales bacterium]|nr:magnesium/cobalt transporter CorA [Nitriliruptorales bacterium]
MAVTIHHLHAGRVETLDPSALDTLGEIDGFLWVDVATPSDEESALLTHPRLGLDPAVIEDMRDDRHLPKLDVLDDQLSLTIHGVKLEQAALEVDTVELDVALKRDLLVTYHEDSLASVSHIANRLRQRGFRAPRRPTQLLHLVLDVMNDVFVPFADLIDQRLDWVEEDILTDPTEDTRREIYGLQRDVIQLRRALVPQAEVIRRLSREPLEVVPDEDAHLFRDVHDHLYRMVELTDSYRQLLDSAMDNYRSAVNDDVNEMVTVLTLISALLLPVSVLAGIYGMNFEYMPELGWRWSYFVLWGVFLLIIGGMLAWFRRRGWIGRRRAMRERAARRLEQVMEIPTIGHVLRVPAYGARVLASTGRGVRHLPGWLRRRFSRRD